MRAANAGESRETEIVARARAGDRSALGELLNEISPRVRLLCARKMLSRQDAEDAAQEALFRILKRIDKFDPGLSTFSFWLSQCVYSACNDDLKRNHYRHRHASLEGADERGTEFEAGSLERIDVERCLVKLDERRREAFLRAAIEGQKLEAIAEALGTPSGTVGRWVSEARALLKVCLGHRITSKTPKYSNEP